MVRMNFARFFRYVVAIGIFGFFCAGTASANTSMLKTFNFSQPVFKHQLPFATAHLVIQVSQGSPARWNLVLNNAQNALDAMGAQNVQIVVVAYGPGLNMLIKGSPDTQRIASMDAEGIEFDACHMTMEAMAKTLGHMPVLVPQAVIEPGGVVRIMQLEAHGFAYVKP